MLKLSNITKNYIMGTTEVKALKGISLEFNSSEFVSVLGPSGCGKTTLLNIIGGLDRYTTGDLIIKGRSTKDFKASDWDAYRNHSIGFVFQSYNLIQHLTVLGNVELALTLSGVSIEERREKAKSVLERVGLSDQLNKKPNQLSGGQMQRVAIARALVNNPEILLTDEPTGALDTETSIQIMDLIKEIANERLVIMVTHNSEIAEKYSTRIIKLLDGIVIDDSNPPKAEDKKYSNEKEPKKAPKTNKVKNSKKTSMSFFTALSLSFKNLITKKVRTIITAIAGSIGIIGIALVLSLSNGFGNYIDKMQSDTLTSYPITINENDMDYSSFMTFSDDTTLDSFPELKKIYVEKLFDKFKEAIIQNDISTNFIDYLQKMDKSLYNSIQYSYGIDVNKYIYTDLPVMDETTKFSSVDYLYTKLQLALLTQDIQFSYNIFQEIVDNNQLIESQYDVIYGNMPTKFNEVVVVVDEYNRISDFTLVMLGYKSLNLNEIISIDDVVVGEEENYNFEDIIGKEFRLLTNNDIFKYDVTKDIFEDRTYTLNPNDVITSNSGTELKISGIIRQNKNTTMSALSSGIGYTKALTDYLLAENINSEIVNWMKMDTHTDTYPTPNDLIKDYSPNLNSDSLLRDLGGNDKPNSIMIYPVGFDSKTAVKAYIDNYTTVYPNETEVKYTDIMEIVLSTMNTMVDAITYVLIAFTAISLIVSSVMIGIITYVSVVERTKEIGVLRSIGARKKDISRVFNAETFIIGLFSGLIGVIVAWLLTIPINLIINSFVENIGNLAKLNIIHALVLVVISVLLTLIAGLIPSRIAANKDPVVALRND
jgi:putative ABC transport system permease protein